MRQTERDNQSNRTCRLVLIFVFAFLELIAPQIPAADTQSIEYNRDIRPILAENCFACHGPDSASRKADLRLDRRDTAISTGAINLENPLEGELNARINSNDPQLVMPPPSTTKTLTTSQKKLLRTWLTMGAEYQVHWSLIAPKIPVLPRVKQQSWIRNPIDRFVLAKLEQNGLSPAPEADRTLLARRVCLDLTGLPPSPELVNAFTNDASPEAYETFVGKLLSLPAWGEHRARYWLDVARYADTNGYHFDNFREAWAYRDWVIDAFNRNIPFDRFTIEQLAGDLLPGATLDQQIASGFNRCNATTNEGGVIPEEYQVLYTRDRTETTSLVWMGLTTGCAVCHDHKFDPISQREFYELSAFFNNTTQPVMDGNVKDTPPTVFVPATPDRLRWQSLSLLAQTNRDQIDRRKQEGRSEFDKWLAAITVERLATTVPTDGLRLVTSGALASEFPQFESTDSGDFERDQPFSFGAWVNLDKAELIGSILARMNNEMGYRGWDLWLDHGKLATHIVNKWPENALKVVSILPVPTGAWAHVFVTYDGSARGSGIKIYINGESQKITIQADQLHDSIRTNVPFKIGQRHSCDRLVSASIGSISLYNRSLSASEVDQLAVSGLVARLAKLPREKRSSKDLDTAFNWWLRSIDRSFINLQANLVSLESEEAALRNQGTFAHVMHERTDPAMAYLLHRGEYDKRRDRLKPNTPQVLPPIPAELPRNRLGLAHWLVRPEHPLTARVTVNRFWQEVFGDGLVRSSGDFGVTGDVPSHPELLDWLAIEFRESGWDVKRLFRTIVESATYRQSTASTLQKLEKDPYNRLLSHGPRFRMDAEMVRDSALTVSGLLVPNLKGPSVKPYQPEGVWEAVAMPESNTKLYETDHGDRLYRRSLYTFWKRSAPPASLDIFNAPNREVCTIRRERTNTPLQALVTLNDPQFIEAARILAQTILEKNPTATDQDRINLLARRLLARPLRAQEQSIIKASLAKLAADYRSQPAQAAKLLTVGESKSNPNLDPVTLAAWTMLANQLMNLDEFLTK